MEISNPWNVDDLDIYLNYCCPQCDAKCKNKEDFVEHAINTHPEAKESHWNSSEFCHVEIKQEKIEVEDYEYEYDPPFEEDEEEDKPLKVKKRKKPKKEAKEPKETIDDIAGEVQCYFCGLIFDRTSKVQDHIRENHCYFARRQHFGPKRNYQCHACNMMCENEDRLQRHCCTYTRFPKLNVYDCTICQTTFSTRNELAKHDIEIHVTDKFFCDKCDFKCKSAHQMYSHRKQKHEMIRDFVCDICGKGFALKHKLTNHHKFVHSNELMSCVCDKCGNEFKNIRELQQHQRKKHPSYIMCTFCQNLFPSKVKLKLHLMRKHQIKSEVKQHYYCWICSQNLLTLKNLDEHLVKDHDFKLNKTHCQLCEKSFCSDITLKAHVVDKHDLEKVKTSHGEFASQLFGIVKVEPKRGEVGEFGCHLCESRFTQKRSLAVHIKQFHDKSNHIKCRFCDYTTFQPYLLNKHEEIKHLKVKRIKCDLCEYECYLPSQLKAHRRTTHEKKLLYSCPECDKPLRQKTFLVQHLFEVHNIIAQKDS